MEKPLKLPYARIWHYQINKIKNHWAKVNVELNSQQKNLYLLIWAKHLAAHNGGLEGRPITSFNFRNFNFKNSVKFSTTDWCFYITTFVIRLKQLNFVLVFAQRHSPCFQRIIVAKHILKILYAIRSLFESWQTT